MKILSKDGVNYGWYQGQFLEQVKRVYADKGLKFLEEVRRAFPASGGAKAGWETQRPCGARENCTRLHRLGRLASDPAAQVSLSTCPFWREPALTSIIGRTAAMKEPFMQRKHLLFLGMLLPAMSLAQSKFDGTWTPNYPERPKHEKPESALLANGRYECSSCMPPYEVKADGQDQAIAGSPYQGRHMTFYLRSSFPQDRPMPVLLQRLAM